MIRVGTAGWQIPRPVADAFPSEGTTLQRYAARLSAVEINSSFYRSHKPDTWARWAETTPGEFRFAVKAPKTVSHERRLVDCAEPMERFLGEIAILGDKLGPVLIQLPPTLAFDADAALAFFAMLRERHDGLVAIEPRHASWFEDGANALLRAFRVARVAADPPRAPADGEPGGWPGLVYHRLHGSPRVYVTPYDDETLARRAGDLSATPAEAWCMFDNTMSGAAAANALTLRGLIAGA